MFMKDIFLNIFILSVAPLCFGSSQGAFLLPSVDAIGYMRRIHYERFTKGG